MLLFLTATPCVQCVIHAAVQEVSLPFPLSVLPVRTLMNNLRRFQPLHLTVYEHWWSSSILFLPILHKILDFMAGVEAERKVKLLCTANVMSSLIHN